MKRETAEVSSVDNWVEDHLESHGVEMFPVEGYSVRERQVTLLLDRRRVSDVRAYTPGRAWREFRETVTDDCLEGKQLLGSRAGCEYHVAVYDEKRVRVYELCIDRFEEVFDDYIDYEQFGKWVFSHNDTEELKKSFINNDNLPVIDKKLREYGTPWPSNLDAFWYDTDGERIRALIEFQTTNKAKPENHSNNRYFSADRARWRVMDELKTALGLPVLIIVWSPTDGWDRVRVKNVDEFVFHGRAEGIDNTSDRTMDRDDLIDHLYEITDPDQ